MTVMRSVNRNGDRLLTGMAVMLEADSRFSAAFVFGSAARGELREGSDIDIAFIAAGEDSKASLTGEWLPLLGRLCLHAGRDVHLIDLTGANHILRFQVFRDGILLFDRDPEATARLLERTLTERFDWLPAMAMMARAMRIGPAVRGD